jgi:hypothetical protein
MTCIVGLEDSGRVFLGADSAGVSGWDLLIRADHKVFQNGPFIMGFTTSFRMGQILRYGYTPPTWCPETIPLDKFMSTVFVDSIRTVLRAGGFAKKESDVESGGEFLVGFRGRLFYLGSDFQVGEAVDGAMAIGCGMASAGGSLFSTAGQPPRDRILMALHAAEHVNIGVRGPFIVLEGKNDETQKSAGEAEKVRTEV